MKFPEPTVDLKQIERKYHQDGEERRRKEEVGFVAGERQCRPRVREDQPTSSVRRTSQGADRLANLTIARGQRDAFELRRLRQPAGATQPDPPCAG